MFEIIPENDPTPLCARCARVQRTCCQDTDVFVTWGDIERIERHTGRDDFYEYRAPVNPEYLEEDDDPVWVQYVIRADGTRRVLKEHCGDCIFLGLGGCELPLDVRPLVCRLYPCTFDSRGILDEPACGCPSHLLRPGQSLFESVKIDSQAARRWHRQLYAEMKHEEAVPCASD